MYECNVSATRRDIDIPVNIPTYYKPKVLMILLLGNGTNNFYMQTAKASLNKKIFY